MIKTRNLQGAATTTPPIDALGGGRPALAHRVHSTHVQADNLLGNDRNVVARVGLHGASLFQVATDIDPDDFTQIYPLRSVARTAARVPPFAVLPGHFLRLTALVCPSGLTVKPGAEVLVDNWIDDGAYGRIDVAIAWTGSPGVVATNHSVQLPTSSETWAAEVLTAGAAWAGLKRVEIPLMVPTGATATAAALRTWSEGVTASVAIAYRGGVRAVDVVLQQVPFGYARSLGVDTLYSSALVTNPAGQTVLDYPLAYPVERRSASDPTYGSLLLADVADRQQHGLGPVLAQWTAWDESTTSPLVTASPSVDTTSTSFVDMLDGSPAAWSGDLPGWCVSGAASQQFKSSNPRRELRDKNACVPVRCWAYCSHSLTGGATFRFQSEAYAIADLEVAGTSPAWRSCTGHLRAGVHAKDASVLRVLGRSVESGLLKLFAFFIEYEDL